MSMALPPGTKKISAHYIPRETKHFLPRTFFSIFKTNLSTLFFLIKERYFLFPYSCISMQNNLDEGVVHRSVTSSSPEILN